MPHIHTEPGQHDHTTSAYIVRLDREEPQILFHMHRKVHKLMQPGGHIELNENPWDSIKHELIEETGYELNQLYVVQPKFTKIQSLTGGDVHPYPLVHSTHAYGDLDHYHTDSGYLFVTREDPAGAPGEGETNDFHWLTEKELKDLNDDVINRSSAEVALFALQALKSEDWIAETKPVLA